MQTQQSYSFFKTRLQAAKTQSFSHAQPSHIAPSFSQQQSTSVYCFLHLKTTPGMCAVALRGGTASTYSRTYSCFFYLPLVSAKWNTEARRGTAVYSRCMHAFCSTHAPLVGYICDCPVAAASLKFLKQEGLWAVQSTESMKLPGYRGNGLEGIFKGTVAQQLLQLTQMFCHACDFCHLTAMECAFAQVLYFLSPLTAAI